VAQNKPNYLLLLSKFCISALTWSPRTSHLPTCPQSPLCQSTTAFITIIIIISFEIYKVAQNKPYY